jgi:hypothetical protein
MSVPAHDQRDFDFARKYGLPDRAGGRRLMASWTAIPCRRPTPVMA